jgi:hypothetical protein
MGGSWDSLGYKLVCSYMKNGERNQILEIGNVREG